MTQRCNICRRSTPDRKDFAFVVACLKVDIPLPEDPPTIEAIA